MTVKTSPSPHRIWFLFVLLFLCFPLAAEETLLIVSGHAERFTPPDRARVSLSVIAESREAAEAQRQLNERMAPVIRAVTKRVKDDKLIETASLELTPLYQHIDSVDGGPRIVGYRASHRLTVRVDSLDTIGPVIDAAIDGGANELLGVHFELSDSATLQRAALADAVTAAKIKADAVAGTLGMQVVSIESLTEGGLDSAPRPTSRVAFSAEAATQLRPGNIRVEALVSGRFRIGAIDPGR